MLSLSGGYFLVFKYFVNVAHRNVFTRNIIDSALSASIKSQRALALK